MIGFGNLREEAVIYHTLLRDWTCMKKKCKKQKQNLRKELDLYANAGIDLWLDGNPSTPKKIEKAHRVSEEGTYMRDYVQDSQGHLTRIGFDSIKKQ